MILCKCHDIQMDLFVEWYNCFFQYDESGYLYIYVSNENNLDVNVYFLYPPKSRSDAGGDDLKITHISKLTIVHRAELVEVQADDYYPFGLSFNSFMDTTESRQNYKYNGRELQTDLDLDWYDYGARMYDAALGRWHVVDPIADKMKSISPYTYSYNNPIYFIDDSGKEPVGYLYYEIRVIVPMIGQLGLTASFNGALYFDIGGDWEVGLGTSESLGLSGGKGLFTGWGAGLNWQVNDIDQLKDFGGNIGGVLAGPKSRTFGGEWNMAAPNGLFAKPKNGLSVTFPVKSNYSKGVGIYVEGTGTIIKKFGSMTEAVNSLFNPVLKEIDLAINLANRFTMFEMASELNRVRGEIYRKQREMSSALENIHNIVKENYEKLSDEEKDNIQKGNDGWWQDISKLIMQVIANGGTVIFK